MLVFAFQWIFLFNYIDLVRLNLISEPNLSNFKSNQTDKLRLSSRSKERANEYRWKDFDCEEAEFDLNLIHWIQLSTEHIYFYFKQESKRADFVIRMEIPKFSLNHNDIDAFHLTYRYPFKFQIGEFLPSLAMPDIYPSIPKDQNYFMGQWSIQSTETTNILICYTRTVNDEANVTALLVDYSDGGVGRFYTQSDLNYVLEKLSRWRRVFYARYDHLKYLEIFYDGYGITFVVFSPKYENRRLWGVETLFINYTVKNAIFLQNELTPSDSLFEGAVVELDDLNRIHFNQYVFGLPNHLGIKIISHFHHVETLSHFFDCFPKKPFDLDKNDVKGFFIERPGVSYLLINSYILEVNKDMVLSFFIFDRTIPERSAKLTKLTGLGNDTYLDKISMKYIKQMGGKTYFTTIHTTYEIQNKGEFSNRYFDFDMTSLKLHECKYQVLEVGQQLFCFDKQTYYFISEDNFESTYNFSLRRRIPDLLEKFEYGNEDIELIFDYKDDQVVFMTFHYLIIMKKDIFHSVLVENFISPNENRSDYMLKIDRKSPHAIRTRMATNCLFDREYCVKRFKNKRSTKQETDLWKITNYTIFTLNSLILIYLVTKLIRKLTKNLGIKKKLNEISIQKELTADKQTVKSIKSNQPEIASIKFDSKQLKSIKSLGVLNKKAKIESKLNLSAKKG